MIQPFKYDNLNYYGCDPNIYYSLKPTLGNLASSDFITHFALNTYQPLSNLNNMFDIFSIKYVFVRKNYQSMLPYYVNAQNYQIGSEFYNIEKIWNNENLFKSIGNQKSLKLINETTNISVFENLYYLPYIYSATSVTLSQGSKNQDINLLASKNFDLSGSVLYPSRNPNDIPLRLSLSSFCNNTLKISDLYLKASLSKNDYWITRGCKALPHSTNKSENYPAIIFKRINPTKYVLHVSSSSPFILVFSESYHPLWKAYIQDSSTKFDEIIANYKHLNVKESREETQFCPNDFLYLWNEPLPEINHFMVNNYANAWSINRTGTYDIILYFLPQSLFYFGLFISLGVIILCLIYLLLF
jgi:hypothetical protein